VVAVLSTAGLASVALMLFILGRLTAKFQAVTRKQSYYYLFYSLAGAIVAIGGIYLYRIAALVPDQLSMVNDTRELFREQIGIAGSPTQLRAWFHLIFYYLPLAVTLTVSLLLAWRNWGWLLRAGSSAPRTRRAIPRKQRTRPRQDP
jgi:hypothetical protein